MPETLLSFSDVELFGQVVADLAIVDPDDRTKVRVATTGNVAALNNHRRINGANLRRKDLVLVWMQTTATENGIYRVRGPTQPWIKLLISVGDSFRTGLNGEQYKNSVFVYSATDTFTLDTTADSWSQRRRGQTRDLEEQLKDSCFARIYGFSYEGMYYDLPRPMLFLVHGEGDLVTLEPPDPRVPNASRAPGPTSITGLAASVFDFADGLRVWSYDKADYTIRMDVETGMFEDVLLDATLGGGSDGVDARGMNARGMNARGMNARGMNARGMNARGMNARGGGSD